MKFISVSYAQDPTEDAIGSYRILYLQDPVPTGSFTGSLQDITLRKDITLPDKGPLFETLELSLNTDFGMCTLAYSHFYW